MMNSEAVAEDCTVGWKYLFNADKQHYFTEGRSLCGRWMTFGWGKLYSG